jgi:nucleoside phosphorylase
MIAIMAAKDEELIGLRKQLVSPMIIREECVHGLIFGKEVLLIKTYAGPKSSKGATEWILARYRPKMIFSIGWAGGIQEKINYGDIIVADKVYCRYDKSSPKNCDEELLKIAINLPVKIISGGSLTDVRPGLLPEEKNVAGKEYPNALMIEMESYEIAIRAKENNIPFLVLRVIVDPVGSLASLGGPSDGDFIEKKLTEAVLALIKAV